MPTGGDGVDVIKTDRGKRHPNGNCFSTSSVFNISMTLQRGYLINRNNIERRYIISGALLWVFCSYITYGFFYLFREIFRILGFEFNDYTLLVLTPNEQFIYNLFYAALASALGYMMSLGFVLRIISFKQPQRTRRFYTRTLNEAGLQSWVFLMWFGKVASILGIWYITYPMQFDIDFIEQFPLFLFLLPLVLFISTWPQLQRIIHGHTWRWFAALLSFFLVLSFSLCFKNFLNTTEINKNMLKSSIQHSYQLHVPKSYSHQHIRRRSMAINIYMVKDTADGVTPLLFLNHIDRSFHMEELGKMIEREREFLLDMHRHDLIANLHIDETIPMRYVNELKYALRKAHVFKIQYATGDYSSTYPSHHPFFHYQGIQHILPAYMPEIIAFTDTAGSIDFSRYKIRIPKESRIESVKRNNRIAVMITQNEILVNGTVVSKDKLEEIILKLAKKYSPRLYFLYDVDEDISYGRYIEYLDVIHSQIGKLRNEITMFTYHYPFDDLDDYDEINRIKQKYPLSIIEWTPEEQQLLKVLEKERSFHGR